MSNKSFNKDNLKVYDFSTHKVIPKRDVKKNTEKFQQLYCGPSIVLAMICSGGACRVMFYILGKGDYGNHIEVEQEQMAKDLNMDKKTIQRHLKELRELNIINIGSDVNDTRRNIYTINPHYTWRASDEQRRIFMRQAKWTTPSEALEQLSLKGVSDNEQIQLL